MFGQLWNKITISLSLSRSTCLLIGPEGARIQIQGAQAERFERPSPAASRFEFRGVNLFFVAVIVYNFRATNGESHAVESSFYGLITLKIY